MSAIKKYVISGSYHATTDWHNQDASDTELKKIQVEVVDGIIEKIFRGINNAMGDITRVDSNTIHFSASSNQVAFRESYQIGEGRYIVFEIHTYHPEFCRDGYADYNNISLFMHYSNQISKSSDTGETASYITQNDRRYVAVCKVTTDSSSKTVNESTTYYNKISIDASLTIFLHVLDNGVMKIASLYDDFSERVCAGIISVNSEKYALLAEGYYFTLTSDTGETYYLSSNIIGDIGPMNDPEYIFCLPVYVSTAAGIAGMMFRDKKVSKALQTGGLNTNAKYNVGGKDYYCFGGSLLIEI